ncbi:MAG: UDP-N-acetylmuramate dehydrogenase [Nitrospirota bacterium]
MIVEEAMLEKKETIAAFFEGYSGDVRLNERLAPYTSLKIGGRALAMVFPESVAAVADLVKRMNHAAIPFFVMGAGSNLLVDDDGIDAVVIQLERLHAGILTGHETFYAEAGLSYPKLSIYAEKQGLSGLEFAAGIPGTVGGAVAMNAGIPGEDTASVLRGITLISPEGEILARPKEAISFSYRSANLPEGSIVVAAEFRLQSAEPKGIERKRVRLLKRRKETQPLSYPNAGSIFKNPTPRFPEETPTSAGALIEAVGLKGYTVGGAQISERHGNFMINLGEATSSDLLALIRLAKERVLLEKGVKLETEIKLIGEFLSCQWRPKKK